ncbi:MAG: T9SS type A sorting domain-containing protein [Bacteroidota bacterium]
MKKNYKPGKFFNLFKKRSNQALVLFALAIAPGQAISQQSYTFTNAGATGRLGPTQGQLNTAYALPSNLNGLVTSAAGVQTMVVPNTGLYRIELWGASGGNVATYSGLGSKVIGEVNLTAGSTLSVLVGQMGSSYAPSYSDGGGGGSFVAQNATLLGAAGGGGGAAQSTSSNQNASLLQTTTNNLPSQFGSQGAGWNTNGVHFTYGIYTTVGQSFFNGGNGQAGGQAGGWPGTNYGEGGFGGGGSSCSCSTGGGGGGGGYAGGGGGACCYFSGTGGSSYILPAATNTSITQLTGFGHGKVIITSLCNVAINGATSICAGQTTTLTSTAVSGWNWSTGSTQPSIVVTPNTTTSYTVAGVGSLNNCISNIIVTVKVNPLPVITGVVTPTLLCAGSPATITAYGANTYTWASGPVSNTATASPLVSSNIVVVGTSTAGCVSTGAIAVNVNTIVVAAAAQTICIGKSAFLTATNGVSYVWNQSIPFPGITVSPATSTVYTVSGVDINNCTTTTTVAVTVNQLPNVSVTANRTTVCKGEQVTLTAAGASTYSWNTTGTGASIIVTPLIDIPYTYTATGTDVNNCSKDATVTISVQRCTGINELQSGEEISVYPNPSNGNFTIKSGVAMILSITNELGQIVKTVSLTENNKNEVNISGLSNGIYFITGENNGTKINKKISVTK